MPNYRLTLSYDGTNRPGWQRLAPNDRSIQGRLEAALTELFGQPVEVNGSGRTDAGVHAAGQVASFTAPERDPEELLRRLRRLLPAARTISQASACAAKNPPFARLRSFPSAARATP